MAPPERERGGRKPPYAAQAPPGQGFVRHAFGAGQVPSSEAPGLPLRCRTCERSAWGLVSLTQVQSRPSLQGEPQPVPGYVGAGFMPVAFRPACQACFWVERSRKKNCTKGN